MQILCSEEPLWQAQVLEGDISKPLKYLVTFSCRPCQLRRPMSLVECISLLPNYHYSALLPPPPSIRLSSLQFSALSRSLLFSPSLFYTDLTLQGNWRSTAIHRAMEEKRRSHANGGSHILGLADGLVKPPQPVRQLISMFLYR